MRRFAKPPIGICIHHSATPDGGHLDTAAFRRYHVEVNGWDEIGYHSVVERVDGVVTVVPGRSEEFCGAHCPPLNSTHLGLCIAGNFDLTDPDDELLRAAENWCREKMDQYRIAARNITYHCDHSPKTCPGTRFPKAGFLLALCDERRP